MRTLLFRAAFFYPRIYAFFAYYRKKERRREFEEKVRLFFPEEWPSKKIKQVVQGVIELRGVRKVMRYLIPHMDGRFIRSFVQAEGLEHLDLLLKERRGVLLIAGHIGIPHLSFNALRAMGYNVTLLSGVTPKIPKHPAYRYYDTDANTIFVHDPARSATYKRQILETLQSGGIIYYDGDAGEGKVKEMIPFLGKTLGFPTGMIHLAHRANAAVVPFVHLYHRGKITLIVKEPIDRGWTETVEGYRRIMTEFADVLQSYVLQYPDQYLGIYGPTVLDLFYRSQKKGKIQTEQEAFSSGSA